MALSKICGAILITAFIYLGFRILQRRSSSLPLPPGPTLISMSTPDRDIWRTFGEWHMKYGPIVSLRLGFQTVIILGNRKIAQDLLEKRSIIYSSRPKSILIDKYLCKGLQPAFMQYDTVCRLHRRLDTFLLSTRASQAYKRIHDLESKQLTYELLSERDFYKPLHRYTSSAMFTLVYGKALTDPHHDIQEIQILDDWVEYAIKGLSIGSFMVDAFPIIDRFPRFLTRWKSSVENVHRKANLAFKQCYNAGIQEEGWNWSREILQRKDTKELSHERLASYMGGLYLAGSHSTHLSLESFVITCLLHPNAVKKVQRELDCVIGLQRLPSFEDTDKLPQVNAFINEVMRWRPAAPLGFPHSASEDNEYMGYLIPANSIVITNQWQMNMDENTFNDPELFQPERWIKNLDLPLSSFGFGRRACPGQQVARSTLFIAVSRLLWAYNILCPEVDQHKKEQAANSSGDQGAAFRPSRFNACFEIRSPEHRDAIEREWASANKDRSQILADIGDQIFGS
ncbi:cytochrome P450 [Penicillium pulvis]|uniref:cytochrome P450 n=1 Tax=Penicillium pulvis TaxID=1562058 RepID=UPI002548042B|nr:cytochrome P450 [Penicillium pulvis]KAJ5803034.1 cytochrome P450 [Penicillium pulvis]